MFSVQHLRILHFLGKILMLAWINEYVLKHLLKTEWQRDLLSFGNLINSFSRKSAGQFRFYFVFELHKHGWKLKKYKSLILVSVLFYDAHLNLNLDFNTSCAMSEGRHVNGILFILDLYHRLKTQFEITPVKLLCLVDLTHFLFF